LIKDFTGARKESEYDKLLINSRNELPRILDHLILQLNKVADEYQSIQHLKQSMNYIDELEDDIEEQLEILLPPYEAPLFMFSALTYIPKYLQALRVRIEKYPHRFEHDQDCIGQYNRLKNKWVEKVMGYVENDMDIPEPYIHFQWQLQELRVSFFAQELKTVQPISIQRMDKSWTELLKQHH
jgi:ATP-dependent helicase HrpA